MHFHGQCRILNPLSHNGNSLLFKGEEYSILYKYTMFCLSVHPLMDIYCAGSSWLLQTMLLSTWEMDSVWTSTFNSSGFLKFKWVTWEVLTGFTQQFVTLAASTAADRKQLWEAVQNERYLQAKRSRNEEFIPGKSKWAGYPAVTRSLSCRGWQRQVT